MAYKKIDGVKPFNELQLRSCYYHQMAAAYTAFGIEPQIIAGNYLPLYEFDAKKKEMKIKPFEILDENILEDLTGVHRDRYKKVDELEKFATEQINAGHPVLLMVDCFYLDYREDTYLQTHVAHSILIYGYDSEKRIFIINEHMFRNSYKYIEKFVPMHVIITAYNNFIDRLMKNGFSLIVFQKKRDVENIELDILKRKISSMKKELRKSVRNFGKCIDFIRVNLSEREKFDKIKDTIISYIGEARRYKNTQRNLLGFLFDKGELYSIADRIVENYIFIYGLIVKMKAMNQYNTQFIRKILARCDELLELESKLHAGLMRGDYA